MKKTVASCFVPNALPGFALTPAPTETLTVGRHAKCKLSIPERVLFIVVALTVGFPFAPLAVAEEVAAPHWVGTWSSSPQPIWGPDFIGGLKYPRNLWNQTVRQLSRVSIGGPRIRVVLSNEYGQTPVAIGAARVGLSEMGPAIVAGSERALNFGGRETVTIPPGAAVLSDLVDLTVAPLGTVAISLSTCPT